MRTKGLRSAFIVGVFFAFVMVFVSCGGDTVLLKDSSPNAQSKPVTIEEGWLSDSEFRVKVSAEAEISSTDNEALRKASEAAATKKAKETVVKNFVISRVKQSPSAGSYAVAAMAIDKEFHDTIDHGKIISKQFESGDRKCTVVFQVEEKDLKKAVEQGRRR